MKCTSCGASDFSMLGKHASFENHTRIYWDGESKRSHFAFHGDHAQFCLRCGLIVYFVDARTIRKYRQWAPCPDPTAASHAAHASCGAKVEHGNSLKMKKRAGPPDLVAWRRAAEFLCLKVCSSAGECWIEQSDSLYNWKVSYRHHDWSGQTLFELKLPDSFPESCSLVAQTSPDREPGDGETSGLVGVSIEGFDSSEHLLDEEHASIITHAISRYGLELSRRRIRFEADGFLSEPLDLIQAATDLARILIRST